MKTILVTGGAGFIGSNLVVHLVNKYPDYKIINLDSLTYAADLNFLKKVEKEKNYQFIQGDIRDRDLMERIFQHYYVHGVYHLAAESHVDNSITGPEIFIDTNIRGTFVLLDVAYRYWMKGPQRIRQGFEDCKFLHVSTDEVYGALGESGKFTENSPYAPNSPYSASKASSDMLVRSYYHTYGLPVVTTNCSNNFGPHQHHEKLIPTVIRKALAGEKIPIYGDGSNIRDWLYVTDHCSGLDRVYHNGKAGEVYLIGGGNERNNNDIANIICETLDREVPLKNRSYKEQISYVEDRSGHDYRYAIDATKIENELGWKPVENFTTGIEKTVQWYLKLYHE
jgi:dTDP-glucose 4,6-dehydratase